MRKQRRRSTAQLISAFAFAIQISMVQSLFFLNLKFQTFNYLLWLYSPIYVGHGRKPRRPVFSQRGSIHESKDMSLMRSLSRVDVSIMKPQPVPCTEKHNNLINKINIQAKSSRALASPNEVTLDLRARILTI